MAVDTTNELLDTDAAIQAAGTWLAKADGHYRQAASLNQNSATRHRAEVELNLALYAKERSDDLRELAHRSQRLQAGQTSETGATASWI
ncbi:hypothetical protein OG618_37750 (plasmid) [Kitasatospora sp. NBC_01246]|uniref:hypothetical protein n=1 Tax=Kitasatospora sp. NBC_01246 TaxID=2903570 RepID=UPI002E381F10|nr:hypothetical protein [Kitasatospora sp. NBC_01246]